MFVITKKTKLEYIRRRLNNDTKWCIQALYRIYNLQTQEEKNRRETIEHNNIGFSQAHVKVISGILVSYSARGNLTDKQLETLLNVAPKYSEQILKLCNQEKLEKVITNDFVVGQNLGLRLQEYGKKLRFKTT